MNTKRALKISLAIGLAFTLAAGFRSKIYADRAQEAIASQLVRFHVLANSDASFDQELKIIVKDGILEKFAEGLNASQSIEETRLFLSNNLSEIESAALEIVKAQGYDYDVRATLSNDKFPTKTYADITLPAGYYDALRVEIGKAEGANWWCVMFPPLCFVDAAKTEAPEEIKNTLMQNMAYEDYELIDGAKEDTSIKIKFKIVELWQELKEKDEEEIILTQKGEEIVWEKNQ